MITYTLVKFSGDRDFVGKATAIIEYSSKSDNKHLDVSVVKDLLELKLSGILSSYERYDDKLKRWVVTIRTIGESVVATVDITQKKVMLITENSNVHVLYRIVESILNMGYDKDVTYRAQKVLKCIYLTVKSKLKKEWYKCMMATQHR